MAGKSEFAPFPAIQGGCAQLGLNGYLFTRQYPNRVAFFLDPNPSWQNIEKYMHCKHFHRPVCKGFIVTLITILRQMTAIGPRSKIKGIRAQVA